MKVNHPKEMVLDVLENDEKGRDYIESLAKELWVIKASMKKSTSSPLPAYGRPKDSAQT